MSEQRENNNVPETTGEQQSTVKGKSNQRVGKGAKQRKTDKFRDNVGKKQLAERVTATEKRLGVFNDASAELERSLQQLAITNLPVAVPLTVSTRGVGFSSVIEYSRMCTTWNFDAINEICTIYQYYRVSLFLAYYKLYLARYEQGESVSFDNSTPFILNEEIRQVIGTVTQVPISTYNILSSIGKIEGSIVWHSIPLPTIPADGEQAALYLYPSNIRDILDNLSNAEFDLEYRNLFHELNPLPGARWVLDPEIGWMLLNAEEIWPMQYEAAELQADVHAYQNVLTRVAGRLPKSFINNFSWSGRAAKSGTVSFDPVPVRLDANFQIRPVARRAPRRDACGRVVPVAEGGNIAYKGDNMEGRTTIALVWSPDSDTSPIEMITGSASFVGEHSNQPTRLQISGRKQAHVSPGTMLYKLVDAPRPAMT